MDHELEAVNRFDDYCQEKRKMISQISDEEEKARQEKVLVARTLLYREGDQMAAVYTRYTAIMESGADGDAMQFQSLQEAMEAVICAGLEDISFNKWKSNLTDAICQVQATEQIKRLPRFSKACGTVLDSLDIDFSDIEDELKAIFEPECIYNTLVLLVTAVKSYCEFLDRLCERQRKTV
ncbi:MAG: hypothetical protein K2K74_05715 [Lachnospiraceae bacterium]|nr:hypothetical protein [Lachnospiraceae bacterium]